MGRILLQMLISVDGMVSGPHGELDWGTGDQQIERANKATLEQASVAILGAGAYPEMSGYWAPAEHDTKLSAFDRAFAHAMNDIAKIVYSHHDMAVAWRNAKVHVVADDNALAEDVQGLKRATEGVIIVYGGVRLARTFLRMDLLDEIHLQMCPVILGIGQPVFTDLTHRTNLRLRQAATYDSGAMTLQYEVLKRS